MRTYRVYLDVANSDDQVTSRQATMSLLWLSTRRRAFIKTHLVDLRRMIFLPVPLDWSLNWNLIAT